MRIEKIILTNFRQYKNFEINFDKTGDNDLNIIIGKNTFGKTNLLNAINWCLYGEEPHLSKNSQTLPRLNLSSRSESNNGDRKEVIGEIWVNTDDNRFIKFIRKESYLIYSNKSNEKRSKLTDTEFIAKVKDEKGNTRPYEGKEAIDFIERFVPSTIREYFFFDGDRLDDYFKKDEQNIRHEIFIISQIDLLERIIEKMDTLESDLNKKAGEENPNIKDLTYRLNAAKERQSGLDIQIIECEKQIKEAKSQVAQYEENLRGKPDIETIQKELSKLNDSKKIKSDLMKQKKSDKNNLLFEYDKLIRFYNAIDSTIRTIEEKRKAEELPPNVDRSIIEEIIKNKVCTICGNTIDTTSENKLYELLNKIKLSNDVAHKLLMIEAYLIQYKNKISNYEIDYRKIMLDVDDLDRDLTEIESKINEKNSKIIGYDADEIKSWFKQLKSFESIRDSDTERLGSLKEQKKDADHEVDSLREVLDKALGKEQKYKNLKQQIAFVKKSTKIAEKIRDSIMKDTRKKLEIETREQFLDLVWNKENYKDVEISEKYNISLIHSNGEPCLGTLAKSESELFALSFTLALHKVSGFNSPILIDTPVARISDEQKQNFAKIFPEISKNKQVILLFTPAEYSEDISKILDMSGKKYKLDSDKIVTTLGDA